MNKQELRRQLLALRNSLSPVQVEESSAAVCRQLLASSCYAKARVLMGYLAFGRELSLDALLLRALEEGKRVCVPRITSATEMEAAELTDLAELVPDRYGIRSVPCPARLVLPEELDLVLVPGVAFGRDGSRLGMGAGYYDRFLLRAPQAVQVGVAYAGLLQAQLPMEEHDVSLSYIVTEDGLLRTAR